MLQENINEITEVDSSVISKLNDTPKLSAGELKAKFDEQGKKIVVAINKRIQAINSNIDALNTLIVNELGDATDKVMSQAAVKDAIDNIKSETQSADMRKSVYDKNNDGIVDKADVANSATHATTADTASHANTAGAATTASTANTATSADTAKTITAGKSNPIRNHVYIAGHTHAQQIELYNDGTDPSAATSTAGAILCNDNYVYFDAHPSRGFRFRPNNGSQFVAMQIDTNGYISIPGVFHNALSSSPNMIIGSDGSLGRASSLRAIKKDIKEITEEEAIKAYDLIPRSFKGIHEGADDYTMYGFVAEEVNDVLPYLATKDENGNLIGVAYDRVCALLLKQNQMLKKELEDIKTRLDNMEA